MERECTGLENKSALLPYFCNVAGAAAGLLDTVPVSGYNEHIPFYKQVFYGQ
jgi:hypothetical protein